MTIAVARTYVRIFGIIITSVIGEHTCLIFIIAKDSINIVEKYPIKVTIDVFENSDIGWHNCSEKHAKLL
jgi:hypothetical protein